MTSAPAALGLDGAVALVTAGSVTVQDVIDIFEPALPVETCMLRDLPGADCPGEGLPTCRLNDLFHEVDETVRATFASVTLATLAS